VADPLTPGTVAGRLSRHAIDENFADLHPPLDAHEAAVAADRCYFCHDAPCVTACPTGIDIPMFIREISTGVPDAAAMTIFDANILGGMCARVCPTETLCEQACVRTTAEAKPVEIGQLQRFATDQLMATGRHPYTRAKPTGCRVAVVGAGPAGLACAHRLACHGHEVVIFEANDKPGGLNEYGIAAYKSVDGFAEAEVAWLLSVGGITLRTGQVLGRDLTLDELIDDHHAVFLGMGLAGVRGLDIDGTDLDGADAAVEFIAALRQTDDLSNLPVGRNVVVIGGGMTAVDAAIQARLLGAETATIAYRRGREKMAASEYEQDLAASRGVRIVHNARPRRILGSDHVEAVRFAYTTEDASGLTDTGEMFKLPADQVLIATGQTLDAAPRRLTLDAGKIAVTGPGRSSAAGVWAGGDCAAGGDDLTVTAVAEGRDAAEDIHQWLQEAN